ncbi:MAG: hypothetical protein ACKPB4_25845 [Sphaerospermopsis kisseleviana]
MQILSLEKVQTTRLFWLAAGAMFVVMFLTAKQKDPVIVATAVVLGIVAIYPLYFWLMGWSHGLPIWPVFSMVHGVTAALPLVQAPLVLEEYTPAQIMAGGMTLIGFFVLGTVVWLAVTARPPKPPKKLLMVRVEASHRYLFAFIVAGLFFVMNALFFWISLPGNTMQVLRGITLSLNSLGIFVLAFYSGRKMLSKNEDIWLAVLAALTTLFSAAGLLMASAIVPVAMLMLGYAFGSGKVPWKTVLIILAVASVLHPGKFTMRNVVWGGERGPTTLLGMPQFYAEWIGYGLQQLGISKADYRDPEQDEVSTLFERSGNIHMLLRVQKMSPNEVPFLNGLTYEPIPRLLVPRFIDDQKGISHAGNVLLSVNYGLQTVEDTRGTSIGWGLVPEAYANFGYVGIAGLALALALFYSLVTNLTVGVPMTSLRFVLGLLIMAAATTADTMAIFVTTQFQGVAGVTVASFFLMRRQANPFAAQVGDVLKKTAESRLPQTAVAVGSTVGPAKWGGFKPPKWAPLSHRKAFELAAARRAAEAAAGENEEKSERGEKMARPRQVAVPIQPYYYRSRKA